MNSNRHGSWTADCGLRGSGLRAAGFGLRVGCGSGRRALGDRELRLGSLDVAVRIPLAPVERPAVTEPGRPTAGGVREAASGIAEHAHRGAGNLVLRARFEPLHEITIER